MKFSRIVALLSAAFLFAQQSWGQVGVSVELGFPQGSFSDTQTTDGTGAGIGVCAGVHYRYDLGSIVAAVGGVEFNYSMTRDEKYRYTEHLHHRGGGTYMASIGLGPRFKFYDTFREVPFFTELRLLGSYVNTCTTTFRSGNASTGYELETCHYKGGFCAGYSVSLGLELSRSSLAIGVKDYGKTDVLNIESGVSSPVHPLTLYVSWTRWFGK
ncbi:MAG TPA: hypothetical protein DHU72_02230 [Rikenellaceae bacterium]|nr:hypothetical protein [Rikenellaceae bacterium]